MCLLDSSYLQYSATALITIGPSIYSVCSSKPDRLFHDAYVREY